MFDIASSHADEDEEEAAGGHSAVLTVSFDFSADERQAVAKTARQAGFNVVQVISQPAAAALAYGLGQIDNTECFKCVVYRSVYYTVYNLKGFF